MKIFSKLLSVVVFVLLAQIVSAETRLWVSNSSSNGDYGGRAGLDAHCDGDLNKPNVPGSATRAFISVDASDEIRDMPSNYNVPTNDVIYRGNGLTQIAPDFATLLDAASTNLINPVTSDAMAIEVYTGSTSTGAVSGTTCNGWTDIFAGSAALGDPRQNTELFLDDSTISCLSDHSVYCITYTPTATVGGTVSGLVGSVTLQNNGTDNLLVSTNGSFTFSTALSGGTSYDVTVLSQPSGQRCDVSNGTGTVSGSAITNVSVTCENVYSVGGTVSGLAGNVTLQNNGTDNLVISADGSFNFPTQIPDGTAFDITVLSQPNGQSCSVSGGSGTVSGGAVLSVVVECAAISASEVKSLPVLNMPGFIFLVSLFAGLGLYLHRKY